MTTTTMKFEPLNLGRWILWGLFGLILVAAPFVFTQGASVSLLSQMGVIMIFGLSYNMLLGQGGMLSFGHAA
jgi:branched-chain amino acid transport system permease protein